MDERERTWETGAAGGMEGEREEEREVREGSEVGMSEAEVEIGR